MVVPEVQHHQPTREARWPASLVVLATLALYVTLPQRLTLGPNWLVPLVELALLIPLNIVFPHRHSNELRWQRNISIALIAIVNAANFISLIFLIADLLQGVQRSGTDLIYGAIQVWLTNVLIFGLWFWELDRGGPGQRRGTRLRHPDFLFPQMTSPEFAPGRWKPSLIDYLYVAFTNATAFSPTDVVPLTAWAKILMLIESLSSLLTVAIVAARAVNILA